MEDAGTIPKSRRGGGEVGQNLAQHRIRRRLCIRVEEIRCVMGLGHASSPHPTRCRPHECISSWRRPADRFRCPASVAASLRYAHKKNHYYGLYRLLFLQGWHLSEFHLCLGFGQSSSQQGDLPGRRGTHALKEAFRSSQPHAHGPFTLV